ncbi:MAG: hypothetical protein F6K26_39135 [Moorea sp. SIO2I5]|nr:hypothetical protein [Moorena sp. SIO2I5]
MTYNILTVSTPAEKKAFLDVPARIYHNDPNWVQPIRSSIAKQLSPNSPFAQYGQLQPFIAISEGRAACSE